MRLRRTLALIAGKSSRWFLKTFFHGGSSLPGKIALKVDPHILSDIAKDYRVVIITGTNGKTLTTALTTNILKQRFNTVLTNVTGANMLQGIVSSFLSVPKTVGKNAETKFAVLEVDEATLSKVTKYIKPELFVFTNIFRDQMDRYGEIYTTYRLITDAAAQVQEAPILANGDCPIFNSVNTANPRVYYGFDHLPDEEQVAHYNTDGVLCPQCQRILHYKMITYANLGNYYCPNCGFHRPELTYTLSELQSSTTTDSIFYIDNSKYEIHMGGIYNVYNALAATAVGEYYGLSSEEISAGLDSDEKVFGRQETIQIGNAECTLILVKNPVGLNQVINMIGNSADTFSLACLLNAHYADGIDTSWIWDGNYEELASINIPTVIAGGERCQEMELRLKVAGFDQDKLQSAPSLEHFINTISQSATSRVYILATYTAVLQLRKLLAERGYIKGGI